MAEIIDAKRRFRPAPPLHEQAEKPADERRMTVEESRTKLFGELDALRRGMGREED